MGLPGQKRSKSSKRRRAAHFALEKIQFSICPKCKKPNLPHRVCPHCGFYKGRDILLLTEKEARKKRKEKEKEDKAKNK